MYVVQLIFWPIMTCFFILYIHMFYCSQCYLHSICFYINFLLLHLWKIAPIGLPHSISSSYINSYQHRTRKSFEMVLKEEEILYRNGKPPLFNCHLANAQDILFTPVYFWQSCGIAVQYLNTCNTCFFFKQKAHVFIVNSDDVYLSHQYICIGHNPQCSHAPRNEINASRRQREAAFEKGEADKMLKIKVLVLRDGAGAVAGDIPPLVGLCWAGWLYDICVDVRACVLP